MTLGDSLPKVYVVSEIRFHRDSAGRIRAAHPAGAYMWWAPYSAAFGEITVVARLDEKTLSDDGVIADGPGVSFCGLPYFRGGRQLLATWPRTLWRLRQVGVRGDYFILRFPEFASLVSYVRARVVGAKVISNIVSDVGQLVTATFPHRVSVLAAPLADWWVRHCVRQSSAVIYVSERTLQAKYPVQPSTPTLSRSNVVLAAQSIAETPRHARRINATDGLRLISVGSMTYAKGCDFLVEVVASLKQMGIVVVLDIIGDGADRTGVESLAERLGVSTQVRCWGQIDDSHLLRSALDGADLYVSGSRAEGLSRALIEAMARGMPVVATRAGATAEVVADEVLADVDDVAGFSGACARVLEDGELYEKLSAQNIATALKISAAARPELLVDFLKSLKSERQGASSSSALNPGFRDIVTKGSP